MVVSMSGAADGLGEWMRYSCGVGNERPMDRRWDGKKCLSSVAKTTSLELRIQLAGLKTGQKNNGKQLLS
jgi:hypothetical protein